MSLSGINDSESIEGEIETIIQNTSSLREVTYSYMDMGNNGFFNETIFIDYLGLPKSLKDQNTFISYMQEMSSSDQIFFSEIKERVEVKLLSDMSVLSDFLDSPDCIDRTSIELLITALEFTKNSLDFELELAGYDTGLSQDEIDDKIQKQEELDEKLFGEHVSKNLGYLQDTYSYLAYLLKESGNNISNKQQIIIRKGLDEIGNQIEKISGSLFVKEDLKVYAPEPKDGKFEALKDIEISREDYMKIFDYFFEIGGIRQRSELGNYSSFYDGDEGYGVPNTSAYKSKTLKELLLLAPHETGHYINLNVTESGGVGKRKGDMLKEEGLAKFTEKLISGIPLDDINYMTFSGPSVVLARLMDGDEYEEFQSAFLTLAVAAGETGSVGNIKQKSLRKMRGFNKSRPGGTNKDASYSLGLKMVLDYVRKEGGQIEKLFGGKISMDDVRQGDFTPGDFGNKYIQHILLSELIFFYLGNRSKIKDQEGDFHNEFIGYLKEKYKDLSDSFGLFSEAERFVVENKMKVARILKIVEKSSNN